MVNMLVNFMVGLKIRFRIEMVMIMIRMLFGMWWCFMLKMVVRFSIDIMIGKVVMWFSVMGRFLLVFFIIRLMLLEVISSRNRLMLMFVLCVMFEGRLCRI